jgi:hypothetical protein
MMDYISYHGGFFKAMQYLLLTTKLRFLELIGVAKAWIAMQARMVFGYIISGFKAMAVAIRTFSLTAISGLRAVGIAMLTTPVGLIITGVAALVGVGYLLWRNWDKVSRALAACWNWIKGLWINASSVIVSNWQKVLKVFLWISPITAPIMALNKLVKYVFGINLFQAGVKIIKSLWEGMKSLANKPIEVIKGITQKIRNFLPFSPAKEGPLATLHKVNIIGTIADATRPQPLVSAMNRSLQAAKAMIQPITQPIRQVLEPLRTIPRPLAQPIMQPVLQKIQAAKAMIQPITQPIRQVLEPLRTIPRPLAQPIRFPAFAAAGVGAMPQVNITQNLTFSGSINEGQAKKVATQVSDITKASVFKAIDEYFRTKARREW